MKKLLLTFFVGMAAMSAYAESTTQMTNRVSSANSMPNNQVTAPNNTSAMAHQPMDTKPMATATSSNDKVTVKLSLAEKIIEFMPNF